MTMTYAPATTQGSGLAVPIFKATSHIWAIYIAITNKWPMTHEQAYSEIEAARAHVTGTAMPDIITQFLGDSTNRILKDWIDDTKQLLDKLAALGNDENLDQSILEGNYPLDELKTYFQQTWVLLSLLDAELLGLPISDPGELP